MKAALTRALNKECAMLPYVSGDAGGKRGRGRAAAGEGELDGLEGEGALDTAEGSTEGADEEKDVDEEETAIGVKKGQSSKQTALDPLVSIKTTSKSGSKPAAKVCSFLLMINVLLKRELNSCFGSIRTRVRNRRVLQRRHRIRKGALLPKQPQPIRRKTSYIVK